MGSAPCNLFCCTKPSIALPKSDIFVPQINIDIIQNTKNLETNVVTSFIEKAPINKFSANRQTTEKVLQEKHKIRNSLTMGGRPKKVKISLVQENEKEKKNSDKNNVRYSLNDSKKDLINIKKNKRQSKKSINNIGNKKSNNLMKNKNNDSKIDINNINNKEQEEESNYELSEHSLSKEEEINIFNIFSDHNLFNNINKESLLTSLKQLKEINIEKDSVIFKEGDTGTCIFVIISGEVEVSSKNSKEKIILTQGSIFGELAVMKHNFKRTYTTVALTNLSIFTLDRTFLEKIKPDYIQRTPFNFEIFNYLSEEQKENLELLINKVEFKKNQNINNLKGLFLIQKGAISFNSSSGKEKDVYEKGEFVGVLRYVYNYYNSNNSQEESTEKDFYTSTILAENIINNEINIEITAKEDTVCHVIPDMAFIEVFGMEYKTKLLMPFFEKTIAQNKNFKNIFTESNNLKEVINFFNLKEYKNNDMLSSALPDDIQKKIIIIVEGQACIYCGNEEKNIIAPGQIIGEGIILGEEQKNVIVESNHLISLECPWDVFKEKINFIGNTLDKWINYLLSIHFLRGLPVCKLVEIAKNIKIKKYKEGDKIIKKSEKVEYVYFIAKGTLLLEIDEEIIQELHTNNSFGEIFIFNGKPAFGEIFVPEKKEKGTQNECIIYKISKNYFFELLSDPLLNSRTKKKLCLEDSEIFPKDLYYIATLHKGPTSNIYLVHNKIYVYIMKAIYIQTFYQASAFEGKPVRNVLNEKEASKLLDNPFLIKYVKTLKNENWCFFISEFINGILLSEYIRMFKPFNNIEITRFYSACFMIMLEALQNVGLIHRDIKQNNIMIEKSGYPRLIDFSCCKKILNGKTSTLIGTPYFMAPEILKGKKYSYSCDYWSVGVLIYYLFYGDYPFGNNTSQPVDIYKEIINKEIEFRDCKKSEFYESELSLQKFISSLLDKNEDSRINNLNQVKNFEFFKNVDFDKIKRQEIKSPFIPEVVKFNYKKELKNCSKPFVNFIEEEKTENILLSKLNKRTSKLLFNNENDKINETNFNYQINLMKWFEKF